PIASNYTHNAAAGLYRVILPQPEPTPEQVSRLEEIDVRQSEIAIEMDDESLTDEAYQALDREHDGLSEEIRAIHDTAPVLPEDLKPEVGLFLKLTSKGEMQLDTVYYSEQPVKVPGDRDEDDGADGDRVGDNRS